jgi:hypothetical protein
MFVWSSSASPVSDVFGGGAGDNVATEQSEQGVLITDSSLTVGVTTFGGDSLFSIFFAQATFSFCKLQFISQPSYRRVFSL